MSESRTEGLDRITRYLHNKAVKQYFRDIDDTQTDITQPRVAAKQYFLLQDDDSSIYATKAMQCFTQYCINDQASEINYYSVPIDTWNITSSHLPQITLYFKPRITSDDNPNKAIRPMEISFRVREEKAPDSNAELKLIANDINRVFNTPPYRYKRGKYKMSYRDKRLGYEFILGFHTELDATNLIKDVMGILSDRDEFNPSLLKRSEPIQSTYVASEQRTRILGKTKQLPNRYESIDFVFSHADYKHYPDKPKRIIWRGEVII